eukprot:7969587-Alexandrium_andersonii.AAC.1
MGGQPPRSPPSPWGLRPIRPPNLRNIGPDPRPRQNLTPTVTRSCAEHMSLSLKSSAVGASSCRAKAARGTD